VEGEEKEKEKQEEQEEEGKIIHSLCSVGYRLFLYNYY
jgi:hypothetical protein